MNNSKYTHCKLIFWPQLT